MHSRASHRFAIRVLLAAGVFVATSGVWAQGTLPKDQVLIRAHGQNDVVCSELNTISPVLGSTLVNDKEVKIWITEYTNALFNEATGKYFFSEGARLAVSDPPESTLTRFDSKRSYRIVTSDDIMFKCGGSLNRLPEEVAEVAAPVVPVPIVTTVRTTSFTESFAFPVIDSSIAFMVGAGVVALMLVVLVVMIIKRHKSSKGPKSLDDVPLDQIEMPWHKW